MIRVQLGRKAKNTGHCGRIGRLFLLSNVINFVAALGHPPPVKKIVKKRDSKRKEHVLAAVFSMAAFFVSHVTMRRHVE